MDIIRQPNLDEVTGDVTSDTGKSFIPIKLPGVERPRTPEERFLVRLAEEQQKAQKKGLPFASAVARADVKDIVMEINKMLERQGFVDTKYKVPELDWNKYSDLKNFDIVNEDVKHDEYLSKIHRLPIYLKYKTYKFKGFKHTYIVMEEAESAVQRALKSLDNRTSK